MVTPSFWEGRRVFITGHTGFKGSWLCLWLQLMGADILGYSLDPPSDPNLFELGRVDGNMTSIPGDIRDFQRLRNCMNDFRPEVVIHLAAQSLVRYGYMNPVETYSTNAMGTVHVLEATRVTGTVRSVVIVTSDKCYENREWLWGYRESDPVGGFDPYSSSKGCAEIITTAYRNSYFHPDEYNRHKTALASARAGNVIGGGDFAQDRLIPDIANAFMSDTRLQIRQPGAVRPWQFVLDPLHGYLLLAEKLFHHGSEYAEAWNFGPSDRDSETVAVIVEKMGRLWGNGCRWETPNGDRRHEASMLKLDSSKAVSRLKWTPGLDLDQALTWTVAWYKTFHEDREAVSGLTRSQITDYHGLVRK